MKQLANGEFFRDIHYRRKDDTKELALSIGEMIKNVRETVVQDKKKIEEIKADIEKGDKETAKKKLDEIGKWFKTEQ
jgi:methyl-accepting chemotaxis protein